MQTDSDRQVDRQVDRQACRQTGGGRQTGKLQALVYHINHWFTFKEEGAGKRCSECGRLVETRRTTELVEGGERGVGGGGCGVEAANRKSETNGETVSNFVF